MYKLKLKQSISNILILHDLQTYKENKNIIKEFKGQVHRIEDMNHILIDKYNKLKNLDCVLLI